MMTLIFDTETTGKYDWAAPCTAAHQPRVVQLGAMLINESGKELATINTLIKPEGFTIPEQVTRDVHGITTERALVEGIPINKALILFYNLHGWASEVAGHNVSFDMNMMRREVALAGITPLPVIPAVCTMNAMTQVCRLPGPRGFKWPKLAEAYRHATGKELEGAHDAMADVRATKEILLWLRNRPGNGTENNRK